MNHLTTALTAIGVILITLVSIGCGNDSEAGEHSGGSEGIEQSGSEHSSGSEAGEHDGESEGSEDGEESGTQLTVNETFNEVRAGARLILSYDSTDNVFKGTVENTTNSTLRRVRVEVHLSTGIELGPTTPVDMAPGQVTKVELTATGDSFTTWNAHAEVN